MKRQIAAGSLVALSTVALTGCFGSDESSPVATVTEAAPTTAAATTAPPPATTSASQAPAPSTSAATIAAPAGATQLQSAERSGAQYTRYSIGGTTPSAVVGDYESELKGQGYTVTNSGGGGGGWGKWGGASAGLSANNGSQFVDVQAGGQSGSTTYFEVCIGPSSNSVNACEDASNGPDSNSKQSG